MHILRFSKYCLDAYFDYAFYDFTRFTIIPWNPDGHPVVHWFGHVLTSCFIFGPLFSQNQPQDET